MAGKYYVYIYFRPNGAPCYVGKGAGRRWLQHLGGGSTNPYLNRIIRKNGGDLPRVKIREGLSNEEAIQVEIALIAAIGRKSEGGPLVNITAGGDGVRRACPPETRERIRAAHIGKKASDATRQKMSDARRGKKKTDEHKAAIGRAHAGRTASDETREKQRASSAKRWSRPEERQKIKSFHDAMTANQKADRSALIQERTRAAMTEDVCRKISEKRRGRAIG